MTVVEECREVGRRLVAAGVPFEEVPHWETRGAGRMVRVDGQLDHHDAVPPSAGHAGGLRICTFGRAGLRNSLCMYYLGSDGRVYLVAAGVSWHAGSGVIASNSRWSGIEARNAGTGEPWPAVQLRSYRLLNVISADVHGFVLANVRDHKEHTSRKIDRYGIDPAQWRRSLTTIDTEEDDLTPDQARQLKQIHEALFEGNPDYAVAPMANAVNEVHHSTATGLQLPGRPPPLRTRLDSTIKLIRRLFGAPQDATVDTDANNPVLVAARRRLTEPDDR